MASLFAAVSFSVLLCLCGLFTQVEAYAIDQSCLPYMGDHDDKGSMIRTAMAEARLMIFDAAFAINDPGPAVVMPGQKVLDNSQQQIFPGASPEDRAAISGQSTLQSFFRLFVHVLTIISIISENIRHSVRSRLDGDLFCLSRRYSNILWRQHVPTLPIC